MPVLHPEGLVQPVRVLWLYIEPWNKMAPHHRANGISRGKISHYEGDERDADNNEDEADKSFDQELNHSTPLCSLVRGYYVFKIGNSTILIPCSIAYVSSLLSKKCV